MADRHCQKKAFDKSINYHTYPMPIHTCNKMKGKHMNALPQVLNACPQVLNIHPYI
jgi:hypothetical protein